MKKSIILLASLVLASCATPKAVVIEQAPSMQQPSGVAQDATEKKLPALADDGLRLPDMLALPEDNQLRSTAPIKKDGHGTIVTSPPSD